MLRVRQIALTARAVTILSRFRAAQALFSWAQRSRPLRPLFSALLGYRRPFPTLPQAAAAVAPYSRDGHENSRNVQLHLELSAKPRPSDYAALFHLRPSAPLLHTVFDLGGNVGNLYYLYSDYLAWPSDLEWRVLDLPANLIAGRRLAADRQATPPLHFTDRWADASQADLLLVSGSLHYLPRPLPEMIVDLPLRPRRLLINRTPLTDGTPVATIQDAGDFRIACMLYNRLDLIANLEKLGYRLIDQWPAAEISLEIPGYPEHRIWAYTGMFFELSSPPATPAHPVSENASSSA